MSPTVHTPAAAQIEHASLIVAFEAGDLDGADLERATALIAECDGCAETLADLSAIRAAVAVLPAPARTRDFRLTDADAARLTPSFLRRALGWFAAPRSAVRPLATGLAALGFVGIVVSSAGELPFSGGTASAPAAAPVAAASAAPSDGVMGRAPVSVGAPAAGATDTSPSGQAPEAQPLPAATAAPAPANDDTPAPSMAAAAAPGSNPTEYQSGNDAGTEACAAPLGSGKSGSGNATCTAPTDRTMAGTVKVAEPTDGAAVMSGNGATDDPSVQVGTGAYQATDPDASPTAERQAGVAAPAAPISSGPSTALLVSFGFLAAGLALFGIRLLSRRLVR